MADMREFKAEYQSDLEVIEKILDIFEQIFLSFSIPNTKSDNFIIAASEIITNAIVHGNKKQKKLTFTLYLQVTNSQVKLEVIDQGRGFNRKKVADPLEKGNLFKTNGRGIYITENLVDDLFYESIEKGTKATIIMNY